MCGLALQSLKRFAEALGSFDRAIAIKPGFADVLTRQRFARTCRFEEALNDFDRALSVQPDFAEAQFYRGLLCLELGRQDEARDVFETGLKLAPRRAHFYLGLTMSKRFAAKDH